MEVTAKHSLPPDEAIRRYKILQYKVSELQIGKVWTEFEGAGFKPILIKGWAAAQLYPEPFERCFVDIDLMVPPACFEEATEFLKFSKKLEGNLGVDLHRGARHLDALSFEDLYSNAVLIDCGGTRLRVLRQEDHLRILCVHWLNDGGADRDKLWDIYYAVANRSEGFDWERALDAVGPRRRKWIICAIGLAYKYLGLEIEDTPIFNEAKNLPAWLIKAVEKEWASEVKLLPLHFFLKDKKMLWKQIKKRLPPNSIQATVELEGEFDNGMRIGYQIRDIFFRIMPSIKRINKNFNASRSSKL